MRTLDYDHIPRTFQNTKSYTWNSSRRYR